MKYAITISSDSPDELAAILAKLNNSTAYGNIGNAAFTGAPETEDDNEPVANIADGELDAKGLPWDARIHAKTKTKTQAGVWKMSRPAPADDLVTAVEAENRAKVAAMQQSAQPAPAAAPVTPPPAPAPVAPPPVEAPAPLSGIAAALADGWQVHPSAPGYHYKGQEVVTDADLAAKYPAPAPAAAPVTPPPPATPAAPTSAPGPRDFGALMTAISNGMSSGKIDGDGAYVAELSGKLGVGQITEIAADPAKIEQAFGFLAADGKL